MKIADIMTTDVVTATPETSFKDAVDLLLFHDVSSLLVLDAERRVIGIVTEADVLAKPAYGGRRRRALQVVADILTGGDTNWVKSHARTAGQLMTTDLVVAKQDERVGAVARRMLDAKVKRVPVVDGAHHLVGIVSRHDLLGGYVRPDEIIADDVIAVLTDPMRCPEGRTARATVDEGVVTLVGEVRHPSDRRAVDAAVWRVPGVVDVIDWLDSREPDPVNRYVGVRR